MIIVNIGQYHIVTGQLDESALPALQTKYYKPHQWQFVQPL